MRSNSSSSLSNSKSFLTKSKFTLGLDCPTKLYYQSNDEKYSNKSLNDPFLEALAKGGFQVGALARAYHPTGVLVDELSNEESLQRTNRLLQQNKCVIFEAAVQVDGYFIRVDILVKNEDSLELIEVKAKSFHPDADQIIGSKGNVGSAWLPYVADVAFQKMVLKKAFPKYRVNSFLMMADKSKVATVNGLNQKFKLVKKGNRTKVEIDENLRPEDLGNKILVKVPVDDAIEIVNEIHFDIEGKHYDLEGYAGILSKSLNSNSKLSNRIGKHCNNCEFDSDIGLSGFRECWKQKANLTDDQIKQPLLFELWRGRLGAKDIITPLFDRQDYFLTSFTEDDYIPKVIKDCKGFSSFDRRNIQVRKAKEIDYTPGYEIEFWECKLNCVNITSS